MTPEWDEQLCKHNKLSAYPSSSVKLAWLLQLCYKTFAMCAYDMGEFKNTLKRNGLSQLSARYDKRDTSQYHNNNQHIEYNRFVKTIHFLQSRIESIFGPTHTN